MRELPLAFPHSTVVILIGYSLGFERLTVVYRRRQAMVVRGLGLRRGYEVKGTLKAIKGYPLL